MGQTASRLVIAFPEAVPHDLGQRHYLRVPEGQLVESSGVVSRELQKMGGGWLTIYSNIYTYTYIYIYIHIYIYIYIRRGRRPAFFSDCNLCCF